MKIEKRPSGSYRIRKSYNGKSYSVTVDYKPTNKEAERLIEEKIKTSGVVSVDKSTIILKQAMKDYISMKSNVLSPSTIKGYNKLEKQVPAWLSDLKISQIESYHVQKFMNEFCVERSPKTARNMLGFLSPVIHLYNKNLILDVTLPQKVNKLDDYIPTEDDVKRLIEYSRGTRYESAVILASFGLRRSEIIALSLNDLNGSILTIDKAKVQDSNRKWVIKTTKTTASARKIPLPDDVADRLREIGMFEGYPETINKFLAMAQDFLDIPHFSLHKLRHFFATKMSEVLPEADVLRLGGWEKSNNTVMKAVYRHSNVERDQQMQDKAINAMKALF